MIISIYMYMSVSFAELVLTCELFEGSIIRAIRRFSELLDELKVSDKI